MPRGARRGLPCGGAPRCQLAVVVQLVVENVDYELLLADDDLLRAFRGALRGALSDESGGLIPAE